MKTTEENEADTVELKKTTICGPRELIERAQEKAKRDNRNFSQYCRHLIQNDLSEAEKQSA